MKKNLIISLLCLLFFELNAQSILTEIVSIQVENSSLETILKDLSHQTNAQFTYDKNRIPTQKEFSLSVQHSSLRIALEQLFIATNIQFKAAKNYISLFRETLPYHTISGYIRDTISGEALIEANIFDTYYFRGSSSNEYGFYSLSLPEGKHIIKSTYIGYQPRIDTIELYQDVHQNRLLTVGKELTEVVVLGNRLAEKNATSILASSSKSGEKIDVEKAQSLPTFMGEKDVLKYLQLLPGVVSGGLAGNNLYIRGGSLDQNLILLDDVPLYNVNHLFGAVSVFNGSIVHSAKTYVDGFPARYGGGLSSIIDIRTKDGNKQHLHGGFSLGFATATAYLEGPIQKDKSSFLVSARRTWLDLPLNLLNANPAISFYDVNAKANFTVSKKDRLYVSVYSGTDTFKDYVDRDTLHPFQETYYVINWGNTAFSLRWNRIVNKKLFLNTTLLRSAFHFDLDYWKRLDERNKNIIEQSYTSQIRQTALKVDFSFLPNSRHQLRFGLNYTFLENNAGKIERHYLINGTPTFRKIGGPALSAQQWTMYAEDEIKINAALTLHPGFRLSTYFVEGKAHWSPQVRFQLNHILNANYHWGFSYAEMMQSSHLLDNSSIESNNNKWVLATKNVLPATSRQGTIYFQSFFKAGWKLKVVGYFKHLKHLRRFQQSEDILNSIPNWEASTAKGVGKTFGAEILLGKIVGKTQGWLAYTLSKSQRKFDNFVGAGYFPYQHDRRHVINTSITHQFPNKRQKERHLSIIWTYATGNWQTVPRQIFIGTNGLPLPFIDVANNYQLPASHRLDLSFFQKKTTVKGFQHSWTFGIFNVYGQDNPYSAELQFTTPPSTFKIVSNNLTVTPIPYVTYEFKF